MGVGRGREARQVDSRESMAKFGEAVEALGVRSVVLSGPLEVSIVVCMCAHACVCLCGHVYVQTHMNGMHMEARGLFRYY